MRPDMLARLRRIMGGGAPVTPSAPVTVTLRIQPNSLRLQRYAVTMQKKDVGERQAENVGAILAGAGPDVAEIDERAGIASDSVPALYLDTWARLNCQKPASVSEAEWRLALDDGGRFLDAWGEDAAATEWSAGELFDVPRAGQPGGLVWRLKGEGVNALGEDSARLADGRVIPRAAGERRPNSSIGNDGGMNETD
jgi:hypothetical protein